MVNYIRHFIRVVFAVFNYKFAMRKVQMHITIAKSKNYSSKTKILKNKLQVKKLQALKYTILCEILILILIVYN